MSDTNDKPTNARAEGPFTPTTYGKQGTLANVLRDYLAGRPVGTHIEAVAALAIADELAALRAVLAGGRDDATARDADSVTVSRAELRRRIAWKDGVIRELFRIATESPDIEAWRLGATHMTAESWTEPDADWTPEG